jgi:alpha-L-fucosidase
VNGEAIYGTRPWTVFGEGPTAVVEGPFADTKRQAFTPRDVRFTKKGATLFAILLAWPADGRATITSLAAGGKHAPGKIADVSLVGSTSKVTWTRDASGLHVTLPTAAPSEYAVALRVNLQ